MSFHESASGYHLDGHHLVAQLEHGECRLDLNTCLGNHNGHFEWDGENFSQSAEDVRLNAEGNGQPICRARLRTENGEWRDADVNLGERIANIHGKLCFQ